MRRERGERGNHGGERERGISSWAQEPVWRWLGAWGGVRELLRHGRISAQPPGEP